jgi:hypothetical protein
MRDLYNWYIGPNDDEVERIWSEGILTVDANVLLDLYRYHDHTREKLLDAIEHFSGRSWLASQAAEELVRNRKSVIASAAKTFSQAESNLEDLSKSAEKTVNRLRSYRLITREIVEALDEAVRNSVVSARESISESKSAYPNYFGADPIIGRIFALFNKSVGSPPSVEEMRARHTEAERRIENEIPPGYLDAEKEGDGAYGDYFLWQEVLSHAKDRGLPMILVTSERKDDWWEKHSGRTVGPRPELLREASVEAQQRILIYQTDSFLQRYSNRAGHSVDADVVEEIRKLSSERDYIPAVSVHQDPTVSSLEYSEGFLAVRLSRPVYTATGSGALEPNMRESPKVWAELIDSPEDAPQTRISAGTGTNFDFNVHIKSSEYGVPLSIGSYTIRYRASLPSADASITDSNDSDA